MLGAHSARPSAYSISRELRLRRRHARGRRAVDAERVGSSHRWRRPIDQTSPYKASGIIVDESTSSVSATSTSTLNHSPTLTKRKCAPLSSSPACSLLWPLLRSFRGRLATSRVSDTVVRSARILVPNLAHSAACARRCLEKGHRESGCGEGNLECLCNDYDVRD